MSNPPMLMDVVTLEKVDGSSNKFYRVYKIWNHNIQVAQWGSQRNGRSGGQFKAMDNSPAITADQQVTRKVSDGYVEVDRVERIPIVNVNWNVPTKSLGEKLEALYFEAKVAARQGATATPPPPPSTPTPTPADPPASTLPDSDRLSALSQRFVEAIATATTDPMQGMVTLAILNEQLEELEAEFRKLHTYKTTVEMITMTSQEGGSA